MLHCHGHCLCCSRFFLLFYAIVCVRVRRSRKWSRENERKRDCSPVATVVVIVTVADNDDSRVPWAVKSETDRFPPTQHLHTSRCHQLCATQSALCCSVSPFFLSFFQLFLPEEFFFSFLELFGNNFLRSTVLSCSLFLKGSVTSLRHRVLVSLFFQASFSYFLAVYCLLHSKSFSGSYTVQDTVRYVYILMLLKCILRRKKKPSASAAAVPNCDERVDNFTACRMSRQQAKWS